MRRVIVIAIAGFALAGCSYMPSVSWDSFKSSDRPDSTLLQVRLDSTPPGADARTSIGPGCATPCFVSVAVPESGFTVTYTLENYLPATVPVRIVRTTGNFIGGGLTTTEPNPVFAQLQVLPPPPPPKPVRKVMHPKKPKPPKAAAAPPAAAGSPFPAPAQAAPPPPPPPAR